MTRRVGAAAAAALVALGCGAPDTRVDVPKKELPGSFPNSTGGTSIASMGWRAFFANDHLSRLISTALEENPDLQAALQRIEIARAGVAAASGARLPRVDAGIGVGATKPGRYTVDGAGNASTEIAPGRRTPTPVPNLGVGVEATWEIDAWGKLRSMRQSAMARYLATVAGAQLVKTRLVAEIASTYFELLALDRTHAVVERTVLRRETASEVVRLQKDAGRANELAVQQFAAQLNSTRAVETELRAQIAETENRLNVLLGRYPALIERDGAALEAELPANLAAGVPSSLLRNRPDIREAELLLEASKFDLEAARAAFFPDIRITAGVGLEAFDPRYLIRVPESIAYSATVGLVAPLVNKSAIEAQFSVAKAEQIEAMYHYQRTVLNAYVEVANGLTALREKARVVGFKKEQMTAVAQTADAADVLYRAGKASYIEVLYAQEATLEAELELVEAIKSQHLTRVALYRALGGGWQ